MQLPYGGIREMSEAAKMKEDDETQKRGRQGLRRAVHAVFAIRSM
jgi:hypothetical protein